MKKTATLSKIISAVLLSFMFASCFKQIPAKYPAYKYAVDYYIPDSMELEINQWIRESSIAIDNQISTDNENMDTLFPHLRFEAEEIFKVKSEGLYNLKSEYEYQPQFIPVAMMNPSEKQVFSSLKLKHSRNAEKK